MKSTFKNILKGGIFPIGGFYGPNISDYEELPMDSINDEVFSLIKDSGINFIAYTTPGYETANGKRFVKMCNKYGIGNFIIDFRIVDAIRNKDFATLEANMKRWVDDFINEPCCLGVYFIDEPNLQHFDVLEKATNLFRSFKYDGFEPYVNLLPMAQEGPIDMCGNTTYEKYLSQFIERVKLSYTSYDGYPFGTGLDRHCRTNHNTYFATLNYQATASKKYGVPFWAYIQCGGQWQSDFIEYDNYPDEGQFNWHVNTCLAFGAKGLEYFPILQPDLFYRPCKNSEISGLIGYTGKVNKWFYYAKRINKFVQENSDFFLGSELKGVIFLGASQQYPAFGGVVIPAVSYEGLDYSESNHALIGVFEFNHKTYYYIVNNSFSEALMHIFRQDPDVLMIGEIRDENSAAVAIRAALTGHLVIATLHTASAAGAVLRLENLGIPRNLIVSVLKGVIVQELNDFMGNVNLVADTALPSKKFETVMESSLSENELEDLFEHTTNYANVLNKTIQVLKQKHSVKTEQPESNTNENKTSESKKAVILPLIVPPKKKQNSKKAVG